MMSPMTQLITTNNQQHVSKVTDDVGMTLLHLSPNVITLRSLLHLRAVITFRSSTACLTTLILSPPPLIIQMILNHDPFFRWSILLELYHSVKVGTTTSELSIF